MLQNISGAKMQFNNEKIFPFTHTKQIINLENYKRHIIMAEAVIDRSQSTFYAPWIRLN